MTMKQFIKENRIMIDGHIHNKCPNIRLSDREREMWVKNDEELYIQARSAGVKV